MRTINAISKILQHVCICQNQCIIEPKYVKTGLNLYFNHISEGEGAYSRELLLVEMITLSFNTLLSGVFEVYLICIDASQTSYLFVTEQHIKI